MERDCYQIEVIYYLNPHLIWVEVAEKSQQDFVFEQIGVYGLLPYEIAIGDDYESLKNRRCKEWRPAASVVMKKAFADASEVWFQPTFIDRRTSIFDDNIHKYGEIILKTCHGKKVELSKLLTTSGFALSDICLFHQELSCGNFKTKLSYLQTQEIIKNLVKDTRSSKKVKKRESSVQKQTVVFQAAQNLESVLTKKNLRKHDVSIGIIDSMLEKKSKDFDRCKDIDDEPLGRATRTRNFHSESNATEDNKKTLKEAPKPSSLLKKKLKISTSPKSANDPIHILMATRKYLEHNVKVWADDTDSNKSENSEQIYKENNQETYSSKLEKMGLLNKEELASQNSSSSVNAPDNESDKRKNAKIRDWEKKIFLKRPKQKSQKNPKHDIATEMLVAYGPPDVNPMLLPTKVVPKDSAKPEIDLLSKPEDREYEEPSKSFDMYADIDSDVDIQICTKAMLKNERNTSYTQDEHTAEDCVESVSDTPKKLEMFISNNSNSVENSNRTDESIKSTLRFSVMQKRMKLLQDIKAKKCYSTTTSEATDKDSSTSDAKTKKKTDYLDTDDESLSELQAKINREYPPTSVQSLKEKLKTSNKIRINIKNNVNPFKNVDPSISVFVDKLVSPVLMVHNKMSYPIEPCSNIRDVNFNTNIQVALKKLCIEKPMMQQMVSWPIILRNYSLFMIGPLSSGKTFGYLPAVCRLITDDSKTFVKSVGPSCIIVCATAQSVSEVEHYARMFLGFDEKVVSCYAGVDELHITTSLLNGCDLFICTPSVLVRLLELTDFGVDLRRLSTFVLEDCARLAEVYAPEVKYSLIKIKEMLKYRANKELKVQFVVASRVWCDFIGELAKKSPNSVICVSAFQECVLYSKANTSVDFLKKDNKVDKVLEFLGEVDGTKKTVIVCRSNDEVDELSKVLTQKRYEVFACNDSMTVEDLYNLSKSWKDYQEPVLGPILVCCDGNLTHLNVTDAHYLVHYSLPHLFSLFCIRFSVLNENYSSIFEEENKSVKIKIFLEDGNAEQLPKILHFIKRCTDKVPEFLDRICEGIVQDKNMKKAKKLVPICDSILSLGKCPDLWNCQERHAVFKEFDEPKDWMPRNGVVTFKILHYHTATQYSVTLLSHTYNGVTKRYAQTYNSLSLKMGMYFSKEINQKLHGIPKVGDLCAVSVKMNFFVRCQVLKILTQYKNGTPNCVLIRLIDEEKLEMTRDIYLFHLPEELKDIETHVVQVRLANVCPKDKDVTFSDLARDDIKKITAYDDDLYMRGKVVLTVGNCVLVDTLEACQHLTSINESVVMHDIKKQLLDTHAIANPEHIAKIKKICGDFIFPEDTEIKPLPAPIHLKNSKKPCEIKPQWAHLENDLTPVFFAAAEDPGTFFIRLVKFESCMKLLIKDIANYLAGRPAPLERVAKGELVLAKFIDGDVERARIDDIVNETRVRCFFVDQGDWGIVQMKDLTKIPSQFVAQMPFQAIECRLVGVSPFGDEWTEFGTNWLYDICFDRNGDPKILYVKQFTKENSEHTDGRKYGVTLIDTCGDKDVVINQLMIDLNFAQENDEIRYLQELDFHQTRQSNDKDFEEEHSQVEFDDLTEIPLNEKANALVPVKTIQEPLRPLDKIFLKQPIRSVPLVDSDNECLDSWDIVNAIDLVSIIKGVTTASTEEKNDSEVSKDNHAENHDPIKVQSHNGFEFVRKERKTDDLSPKKAEHQQYCNAMQNKPEKCDTVSNALFKKFSNTSILKNVKSNDISLDSDDLSSTGDSHLSEISTEKLPKTEEISVQLLDTQNPIQPVDLNKIIELRKPKLLWRQNKTSVSIKIQLIGVKEYHINLVDRSLKFDAICNDIKYGFELDLYGVVDGFTHSDKGQYILVKFNKIMKKLWITLTKDGFIRKWIVYDVDSIDSSSDEEEDVPNTLANAVKKLHNNNRDSDSDDDFLDDINFENNDFC